jgi:hypothetical protein
MKCEGTAAAYGALGRAFVYNGCSLPGIGTAASASGAAVSNVSGGVHVFQLWPEQLLTW